MNDYADRPVRSARPITWMAYAAKLEFQLADVRKEAAAAIESLQAQLAEAQLARGLAEGGLAEVKAQLAEAGIGEHGGDTCGRREAKYRGLVELVDEQSGVIERMQAQLAEAVRILETFHGEDDVDAFLAKTKEQP